MSDSPEAEPRPADNRKSFPGNQDRVDQGGQIAGFVPTCSDAVHKQGDIAPNVTEDSAKDGTAVLIAAMEPASFAGRIQT